MVEGEDWEGGESYIAYNREKLIQISLNICPPFYKGTSHHLLRQFPETPNSSTPPHLCPELPLQSFSYVSPWLSSGSAKALLRSPAQKAGTGMVNKMSVHHKEFFSFIQSKVD